MRFFTILVFAALAAFLPLRAQAGGYTGLYRGIVTSPDDPTRSFRLRVQVPDVTGNTDLWAVPSVPYTPGAKIAGPPPGSTVWIMFEQGDAARPVWIGWLPARGGGLDPRTRLRSPSSSVHMH